VDTSVLRALLAKAAPVPWTVQESRTCGDETIWVVHHALPVSPHKWESENKAFDDGTADGEYGPRCSAETRDAIVALVNAAGSLLDEVDRLRAQVKL